MVPGAAATEAILRAAIYARVSDPKQKGGYSLETQESGCRRLAGEEGAAVLHFFREIHTGVELWERPELTALRDIVRRREIDVLYVYSIDRLARDPVHLGVILSEAAHSGVEVRFVTEPHDDSPEGQLIHFVKGYAAKVEHEKIKERTMRGRRARVESGKLLPGNRPPYGYQWVEEPNPRTGRMTKTRLIENAITGPIVRRIFQEVAAGVTARSLAMRLSAEGVPTPTGKARWSVPTIGHIIRHPVYVGEPRAFRYRWVKVKGRRTAVRHERPESEQVIFAGAAPALVSKELAAAADERLRRNKSEATRRNANPEAALLRAGYAVCAYCGHPLSALNTNGHGILYRCNSANRDRYGCPHFGIQAHILDAAVWADVEARIRDPAIIAAEVWALRTQDPTSGDLAAIERRTAEIERRQRNLVRELANQDDDDIAALVRTDLAALGQQAQQLAAERAALVAVRDDWEAMQGRLAELATWCRTVAANLDGLNYEQRRLALHAFGVKVKVWKRTDRNPPWEITASPPILTTSSCSSSRCRT